MKYNWPQNIHVFVTEGSTVPDGFEFVSAANGKYIRSGTTTGSTGGGSHSHAFNPSSVDSGATLVGLNQQDAKFGYYKVRALHRHSIDRNQETSETSTPTPPFITALLVKKI